MKYRIISTRTTPLCMIFAGSSLAYYMLMTTFSLYLHDYLGLSITTSGLIMFAYSFSSRISKVFFGPLFDTLSFRLTIPLSLAVAALGFFLAAANGVFGRLAPWFLCIAGLGISSIVLLTQAFFAHASRAEQSNHLVTSKFSFIYILMNASALVAPVAGIFLLNEYPSLLFIIVSALYLSLTLFSIFFLQEPSLQKNNKKPNIIPINEWIQALSCRQYRTFLLTNTFFWILYSQLFSTIPLYARTITDSPSGLQWIFAIEALTVIALQSTVSRWLQNRHNNYPGITAGLFSTSFILFFLATNLPSLTIAIMIFAGALMVFLPSADAANANFSQNNQYSTYFGLLSVSAAFGDAMGNAAGMAGFAWLQENDLEEFYFLLLAVTITTVTLLYRFARNSAMSYKSNK